MALDIGVWYIVISVWEMVWKGLAMWKSAKNDQKYWFISVFILNTIGILPIIYLGFFQKGRRKDIISPESLGSLEPIPELKEVKPKKKPKKTAKNKTTKKKTTKKKK